MSESGNREGFVEKLVAQDPPLTDQQIRHNEDLFKQIKLRANLQKAVIIAIYMAIYLVAFGAFMLRKYIDNAVHSVCLGTVSLHILLWSLVYILRGLSMLMGEISGKISGSETKRGNKGWNLFITVVAIVLFVENNYFLCRSFFLTDPLRAAEKGIGILWGPTVLLIFYAFSTAELMAKLWLEHKKMQLYISTSKSNNCSDRKELQCLPD
jgi:cytochrome c biogenesis factor